jgi:hypothetical protein
MINTRNLLLLVSILYIAWNYFRDVLVLVSGFAPDVGRLISASQVVLVLPAMVSLPLRQKRPLKQIAIQAVAFAIAIILSFAMSSEAPTSFFNSLYDFLSMYTIFAIYYVCGLDPKMRKYTFVALIFCAFVNAAVGVYGAVTKESLFFLNRDTVGVGAMGYDETTGRSGGFRGENYVGTWNAPLLAYATLAVLSGPTPFSAGLLGLGVLSVLVSFSRTSLMTAIAVFAGASLLVTRRVKQVAALALIAFGIWSFMHGEMESLVNIFSTGMSEFAIREQTERFNITSTDDLYAARAQAWTDSLEKGLRSPLVGNGPGVASEMRTVPHNAFLDVFVDFGLLGLVAYLILPLQVVLSFLRAKPYRWGDRQTCAIFLAYIGMSVAWISLSSATLKIIWIAGGLALGSIMSAQDKTTPSKSRVNAPF